MTPNDYDPAIEAIRAEREKAKIAQELERKKDIVSDLEFSLLNCGDGSVIKFKKKFDNGDREYSYAALNVGGRWYTTGATHPQGFNQEDFILWLASGEEPTMTVDVLDARSII